MILKKELMKFTAILKDENYLQECGWDRATWVIATLDTTCRTVYVLRVLVVRILKQQPYPPLLPKPPLCKQTFLQCIHQISENISKQSDSIITKHMLCGNNKLDFEI